MRAKNLISLYCSNFIYIAIILIPFVASFSSAFVNILIGFSIFAFVLKKTIKMESWIPKTVINLPFLFLVLFSLASFINSTSLKASMGGIAKLAKYGFLFLIISEGLSDKKHLKRIIIAIILGLYLASLDGLYQLWFGRDFLRNKPYDFVIGLCRIKSTFPHTNMFATYLGLFLPVLIALTLYHLKRNKKLLFGLIAVLIICCLILTFSRGAILGFLASIIFMAILKKDKLVLILLIIILAISPFFLSRNVHDWIKTTDSVWEILLNKERINIYKTSLNMIKNHPLIGVGVNTYCLNYQKYKIKETSGFTGDARYYAHNIFLHMAGEIGLTGLVSFLWLLFVFFRSWFRFFKFEEGSFLKNCSLGIVAGIIAFLINGLTETTLYYSKVATLFWYQMGLFLGLSIIKDKEKENG